MISRFATCASGLVAAFFTATLASAQVTVDTPLGNIRSRGAVIPQQGPLNEEGAGAVADGIAPVGTEGARSPAELNQTINQRREKRIVEQERQSSIADSRAGAEGAANTWRYARSNGHWWYWMPDKRWAFYYRDRWVPYDAKTYGQFYPTSANTPNAAAIAPAPTRYGAAYRGDAMNRDEGMGGQPAGGATGGVGAAARVGADKEGGAGVRGGFGSSQDPSGEGTNLGLGGIGSTGAGARGSAAANGNPNAGFGGDSAGSRQSTGTGAGSGAGLGGLGTGAGGAAGAGGVSGGSGGAGAGGAAGGSAGGAGGGGK